jgi:hypothetical protein
MYQTPELQLSPNYRQWVRSSQIQQHFLLVHQLESERMEIFTLEFDVQSLPKLKYENFTLK